LCFRRRSFDEELLSMTQPLPTISIGRAELRALGAARGLEPLIDYTERHGCNRSAVYKRADIPRTKIKGIAFVPVNAPVVKSRKRGAK
jgi:hypothetical protein